MTSIQVGVYQISVLLILLIIIAAGTLATTAWYLFATNSVPLYVEEPLSITNYPNSIHVHPGENATLDVTILNSASVDFLVTLAFALNDSVYQETYVTFSNSSYTILPGENVISTWLFVNRSAHPALLNVSIGFYRE
ncbi:MAG: hypothetical protein JSV35_01110 [Candidatus Bathyarchaeota archaeon]|nr:MAG: hypothetical protein JSV35_01110 [Candidatus Bathyarchaeota archaeon]